MDSLQFIGHVRSSIKALADSPRQEDEGAPSAELVIDSSFAPALRGLSPGSTILILTWLHKANRMTLVTHPRNDLNAALSGVFATRSPDRPNPIGLHTANIVGLNGTIIQVDQLEVLDGTPILDIKPLLTKDGRQ